MPSSGSALNLSLLSRGIGEISKNGHERIDVVFEPQDYFNFVGNSSRIYLPPIPPKYDFDGTPTTSKSRLRLMHEMPKTFTTRKGALLLFSEDQAYKTLSPHHKKGHHHHRKHHTEESLELSKSADDIELKTVDDLAKSILSFGKREPTDDTDIYLGFVHDYGRRKKDLFERQIRPGFSAKRYLSLWTKSWDDNVLGKVISKGYLTEKSLFYYNPLNPHLQRRLNDDMSHYPAPYKLMRSMLMSPGSLSGYTFYRVRPESADTVVTPEQVDQGRTPSQMGSIKVISTKDGVQKEVSYANLDKVAQEEVLTDLLVKSAVHYAMKKQQELIEESQREQAIPEVDESRSSIQQFDMRDAVESLLDSQRGKGAINTDFPEDKSEASSKSGSIKGRPLKKSKASSKDKESEPREATSPLPADFSDGEKEYFGSIPVASIRGEQSSVPQLPHIAGAMPLTPIGEASREGTRMTIPVSLPPIGQDQGIDGLPSLAILPPTPQHSNLSVSPTKTVVETKLKPQDEGNEEYSDESGVGVKTERTEQTERVEKERKRRVKKKLEIERTGPSLSGGYHLHSSSESLGPGSANSLPTARPIRTHWKGSTQSLKSDRSKKGSNTGSLPEDSSKKGSIIIAPDGEAVNVGGHIEAIVRPDHQHIENVGDANRLFGRGSRLSDILVDKYKKDLASDLESDEEPDAWKRRKGVQREDIRGYANKRDKVTPRQRRNVKSRQPIIKSRSNTVSTQNKTVRFSASSKDKDEGFEEIDYTAGDIDATLSMSSWSYMPRDFDPEFAGIAGKADRANSLPSMPFRTDDKSKDFTQHLSRATEKTEEGYEGEVTPDKTRVSVPVSKEDNTGQDRGISQTSLYGDTPGVDSVLTNLETPLTITEDNLGYASKLSRHDEEELNDNADQRSKASSRQSFQKQKSVSLSGKGSASKTNRDSRPASISEVEHHSLSRKDSRNSKISMRSMSKLSSHHEQDISLVDSLQGIEHEVMSQGEINTSVNEDTPQSGKGTISPPGENYSEGEKQDSDSRCSRKTASPIGTVAPSRPGSGQSIQSQQVSEKDIIDVLENTARQVAASTLSRSDSGQDLEKDARQAAELWLEKNAPRIISRSQSVQDTEGADEAIKAAVENGRKSAGPTAGEYKELIKEKLQTALSNTDGESIPMIPDDAELSPELLEALKNNSITPDDIEVIHDEETGKDIVRSRSQMSAAMGGVKEGHIYVPVGKNGNKQPGTIPTDRQSNVDIGDFEVINYGKVSDAGSKVGSAKTHSSKLSEKVSDKAPSEKSSEKGGKSQPPSVLGESIVEEEEQEDRKSPQRSVGQRSEEEVEEPEDEFKKAVEEAEKVSEAEQQKDEGAKSEAGQPSVASDDKKSIKSAVSEDKTSKVSIKTEKSDVEKKKPEKKKEEFVVGKVKQKNENEALYGDITPPPKGSTPPGEDVKVPPGPKTNGEITRLMAIVWNQISPKLSPLTQTHL